ncbi:MAG: hypothetical protein EOO50_05305 [Flavobacterium sp.]|uniref:hypothetical protein n=1 Tax=Flavobacterium sp. TaxID=239 RepID=UPI0011FDFB58|nr:hypothetical protein [Flavobacterium sp.]RZJ67701.1 MAG: hypothetical protein EOO50_05305 [Flavobacterium sp.]
MKGTVTIENLRGFSPFQVSYRDLTEDVIEVDVKGRGILRENQDHIQERLRETWMIYDELTLHSSKLIGYTFDLKPGHIKTKVQPGIQDAFIDMVVTFEKPFKDSADRFVPTTELIVSNILESIFVIPTF